MRVTFSEHTFRHISNKIVNDKDVLPAKQEGGSAARAKLSKTWFAAYSKAEETIVYPSLEFFRQFAGLAVILNCKPEFARPRLYAVSNVCCHNQWTDSEKGPFDHFVSALQCGRTVAEFQEILEKESPELFTDAQGELVCQLYKAFLIKEESSKVEKTETKEFFESHGFMDFTKVISKRAIALASTGERDVMPKEEHKAVRYIVKEILFNDEGLKTHTTYNKLKRKEFFWNIFAKAYNALYWSQEALLGLFAISSWVSYGRFQNVLAGRILLALSAVMALFTAYNCGRVA